MGAESMTWYNNNIMIGHSLDRTKWEGNGYARWSDGKVRPWWQNNEFKMLYPGAIPIGDIESKLFKFDICTSPVWFKAANGELTLAPDYQLVYRHDNNEVFGVFSEGGYQVDQFKRTLIDGASTVFDVAQGELGVGSAGLLKGGAVAWVSMELPKAVETPEGMTYRPTVTLIDSYNGWFKFGIYYYKIIVVCDNGLLQTQNNATLSYSRKHTSQLNVTEARQALKVLWTQDQKFKDDIAALAQWSVTDRQFNQVLDELVPVPERKIDGSKVLNQRSITNADNKRGELQWLWADDPRAAPWHGTGLGVFQVFNTWDQHMSKVRGSKDENGGKVEANRVERNMLNVARGRQVDTDTIVLEKLAEVCDVKLGDVFQWN